MKKVLSVYVTPLEMDSTEYHLVDLPAAQDRLDTLLLEMNKGFPLYTEVSDYCGREYLADHMPEDMDLKELNLLAGKLAEFSSTQEAAFEGLVRMDLDMEMDVRIFPYRGDGPVAATASVTLNGCFAVRDVRIMEGKNGLFVSMPRRKVNGEYRDICYPCTKDFKQQFDQKVLEAYEQSQVQEAQKSPAPKEGQEENGPTMAM